MTDQTARHPEISDADITLVREWLTDLDANIDNPYDTQMCDTVRAVLAGREQLAARVAELEDEMRQLLTGSVPRSLALALACVTCHTCVGVFVTQDALDRWARTNGWRDGRCPDCDTTEGA